MKICFVTDKVPAYRIGGAERQCFEVGRELARRGHEVHMTSRRFTDNQPDSEYIDGVNVHTYGEIPHIGNTVVNHLRTRIDFLNVLREVDCDLYHNTPPSPLTGLTRIFTQLKDVPFTFALAHEQDYDRNFWQEQSARERFLYYYGLKRADARVALADYMQNELEKSFGLDSTRIYIGHPLPDDPPSFDEKENAVIWMARLVPWKNPEKFIELAERADATDWSFHLIGEGDDEYEQELQQRAEAVEALHFEGKVEPGQDTEWFRRAKLFVDTSESAGFSNTFIQAWIQRTPVASLYLDPDSFIERMKAGVPPQQFDLFCDCVVELLEDESKLRERFENSKFADDTFGITIIADQYEKLFEEIIADHPS